MVRVKKRKLSKTAFLSVASITFCVVLSIWFIILTITTWSGSATWSTQLLLIRRQPFIPDEFANDMIDILSIGSILRPNYQETQRRTFGSHRSVRAYYPVQEVNDTDPFCSTHLSTNEVLEVIEYCNTTQPQSAFAQLMKKKFRPRKDAGWLCAQRRPLESLYWLLQQYKTGLMDVPTYLIIVDDDTYLPNMDAMSTFLRTEYSPDIPHVVGSCFVGGTDGFMIPFGGFGTILTKAAIHNLLHEIQCNSSDSSSSSSSTVHRPRDNMDHDTRQSYLACDRLMENNLGEKRFFRNGMSVADLMYEYSLHQPYTAIISKKQPGDRSSSYGWTDLGFCMHSDHALAYFLNMYYIACPVTTKPPPLHPQPNHPKRPLWTQQGYTKMAATQCDNRDTKCYLHNLFCHYITPDTMDSLYRQWKGLQSV